MSLMGIDLGTSCCKGVVFDEDGVSIAQTSRSYETFSLKPSWVELDANKFWEALVQVVRELAGRTQYDPIVAFAVSSQGETMIPVDKLGDPVRSAFMNADNRAVAQIMHLNNALGRKRIYEITGEPSHPMFGVSDLMWFKENEPDLYRATSKMTSCEDFIMMKLGFEPFCNYSNCCRTLMLDIRRHDWSDEILEAAGVSRDKLGVPVESGIILGKLDKRTAGLLGLREGVAVVSGGHDVPCSALGSGVLSAGTACDQAGTYEGITSVVDSPNTSESAFSGNLNTYCHVLKDKYISLVLFPAGFATKWFVTQFCEVERLEAEKRDVSVFDVLAEKVAALADEPTYIYVTPHFVGSCNPHNDVRATGTIVGLTPFVDRIRMYKAVYEGIAYEFSIVTDVLEHNVGKLEMVRINGGGAKSNFTLALRSNVSGRTISRLTTNETVCLGAAMLSGIAVGIYRDYQDAVDQTVRVQDSVKPDKRIVELYRKPLQMYETIYRCLEPVRELSMT